MRSVTAVAKTNTDSFKPIERQRLSHLVADQIEEAIIQGRFKIGTRLPAEQALAEQFGVSRNVVREALKLVQARELVEIVNGSGAFVAQPDSGATRAALGRYLRFVGVDSSLKSLYEVRKILEGANARLAAARATPQDLQTLAACLERMQAHHGVMDQWVEADLEFHLAIADATQNPFLRAILEPLVSQLQEVIAEGYRVPGATETGFKAHQRILKAIRLRDPDAADRAVMHHLQDSEQRVLSLSETR